MAPFIAHLVRRGARHSFRCRVSVSISQMLGRSEVVCALGTADGHHAAMIARVLAIRMRMLWLTMHRRSSRPRTARRWTA